ncbi:ribbon-helix-helix domain-containing protein [Paracoccus binzhouensis]
MATVAKRTVSLPPEHTAFIDELVASGTIGNLL